MFSLRRKATRPIETPGIRISPSLPELNPQGIPWPENLVDINSIRDDQPPESQSHTGAAKTSFGREVHSPIPFHKPFRSPGKPAEGAPISSLYMHPPPSAFKTSTTKYSQRRARLPPTFNLMVVGAQGTGKTSLLRLLLETADISPTATVDQRAAVDQVLRGPPKATQSIHTACVEICESRFDRVLFSVIDTPGLDFVEGKELKLERQVSGVLKYVDAQYADTMSEESKVIRKNKGDQHVHLCIYMIDPSSLMTPAARRAQLSLPTRTRSEATVSKYNPPDLVPDTSSDDSDDDEQVTLTMSPAEIRVIRRLSARINVLPVIAHADSLTDDKLAAVKAAIHTGLVDAGLGFGVFSPKDELETPKSRRVVHTNIQTEANGTSNGHVATETGAEEEGERQSRPIIKLRSTHHSSNPRALSRSRSRRRDLSVAAVDHHRPVSPDLEDQDSVANVRFSAAVVAKSTVDLASLMPFALIAPESTKNRHRSQLLNTLLNTAPSSPVTSSDDEHAPSIDTTVSSIPQTPASLSSTRNPTFLHGPPEDLKGVFVRRFRWGTVDVLDPNHCDFAALRTAVLCTHLNVLKSHTKEVLYEKYRTEKLLARRATRQITDSERDRLLEEIGL
ncbi:septin family protein [Guyanagaster necrorhizus]|uniref:Septin family protein n=1 Tax=Guyanagaster necrorhizus TaxID=856835 RepID=A0A9P7VSG0_9AGAR|nr:septin family protein [Guyanagaster necrorhizus MCA 3950]KAG7445752.1 septin family protein [Guyanagaster necrorhizus MCA 3950]